MTRREAAEKIFQYIRENKFEPINIQYGDGYFIFDMGADGVVHFNIKGLYGWKFAMWIETDAEKLKREDNRRYGKDYPAIQFFCQHELNMDKFKPSRSFHLVELSLEDVESDNNWIFYEIKDMLQMIKRHPLIAFTMDAEDDRYCNHSYLKCYLDMKSYKTKQRIKEWWNDTWTKIWHGSKVWFVNKYKVVDKVEFVDKNDDDWKVYPRYDMQIHFKKISDDENIQENAEIRMLDFWFHKNSYSNMNLDLTREGCDGRYSYRREERRADGNLGCKIKQFLCGLFQHSFCNLDTDCKINDSNQTVTITETCCKCGKKFSFTTTKRRFGL